MGFCVSVDCCFWLLLFVTTWKIYVRFCLKELDLFSGFRSWHERKICVPSDACLVLLDEYLWTEKSLCIVVQMLWKCRKKHFCTYKVYKYWVKVNIFPSILDLVCRTAVICEQKWTQTLIYYMCDSKVPCMWPAVAGRVVPKVLLELDEGKASNTLRDKRLTW